MNALLRRPTWLSALALLALACPTGAAPVRPGTPGVLPTLQKYLPDDADGVLLVNVKQIVASPLYTRNFKKKFDTLLAKDEVKPYLKDLGFDPLKDVEHLAIILARSCHAEKPGSGDGPIFLAFGKFDSAKLKKKMGALAAKHPKVVQAHSAGGSKFYELRGLLGGSGAAYAAQLDRGTLILAGRKGHVTDALAKASGKKKTKLKYPALTAALKKWKDKTSVQGVALESMVTHGGYSATKGAGGGVEYRVILHTLGESGFKGARLNVDVKDVAKGSATLTAKDKGKLKTLLKKLVDGKEQAVVSGRRAAERERGLAPLIDFLANVKVKSTADSIVMEGKASATVFQAFLDTAIFPRGAP
jgi:hypothetical protein